MILRAIELMVAWFRGTITDQEFLDELHLALARAQQKGWIL